MGMSATFGIARLPEEVWEVVGKWCDAETICRIGRTASGLLKLQSRCIRGRVTRMCECVFDTEVNRTWITEGMSVIDLARVEACIMRPIGACVCCLKPTPLKLGSRCVECVGQEALSFQRGSASARRCGAKCRASHDTLVYTCPVCEFSVCLPCLCAEMSCGLCHMSLHPRFFELLSHVSENVVTPTARQQRS
jgi:hypothetical protein